MSAGSLFMGWKIARSGVRKLTHADAVARTTLCG
jgi:hypothetical protein